MILVLKITFVFAMIIMANTTFYAKAKVVTQKLLYGENFAKGFLSFDNGKMVFVQKQLTYTSHDTIQIIFSANLQSSDTVYVECGSPKAAIAGISYKNNKLDIFTHREIIRVDIRTKQADTTYDLPHPFFTFGFDKSKIYGVNSIPGSVNGNFVEFRELFERKNTGLIPSSDSLTVLPTPSGFDLMLAQPREAVAFFDEYVIVADPCLKNLYYYTYKGELLKSVRLDSLLGISGICNEFKTFKVNEKAPKRDFDRLLDISEKGSSIRSIINYKDKLLIRTIKDAMETHVYVMDPETLWHEEILFGRKQHNGFTLEDIPIGNYDSIVEGKYLITMIHCDISGKDISKFAHYEDFKKYINENRNTGTSYLVREIVFE